MMQEGQDPEYSDKQVGFKLYKLIIFI